MLMNKQTNPNDIIAYMHQLSSEYNIDKKAIIHNYFNYIIRNKPKIIQKDILNIMTNLIHNTDVKIEQCLNYFCYQLHEYYSAKI